MPSATTPLAVRGREGGGGGAPSQKTCRSPSIPEPLAEGGFVAKRLLVLLDLVVAQDDNGKPAPVAGVVLKVDKRSVPVKAGKACIGPHKGLVRAVAPLA